MDSDRTFSHENGRRRIGKALARLFVASRRDGDRPVARPGCEYGLVVEERLKDLARDLDEVKAILKWLLLAVLGTCITVVVEMVITRAVP